MNRLNQNDFLKAGSGQIRPNDPAFAPGKLRTSMSRRGFGRKHTPACNAHFVNSALTIHAANYT
jgi:hypothetical protein